jgi:hypothetical protein
MQCRRWYPAGAHSEPGPALPADLLRAHGEIKATAQRIAIHQQYGAARPHGRHRDRGRKYRRSRATAPAYHGQYPSRLCRRLHGVSQRADQPGFRVRQYGHVLGTYRDRASPHVRARVGADDHYPISAGQTSAGAGRGRREVEQQQRCAAPLFAQLFP